MITRKGQVLLVCVCDGMGGLEQGEVASGYIVEEVSKWFYQVLLPIIKKTKQGSRRRTYKIKKAGFRLFFLMNQDILSYGKKINVTLGSTASVFLLLEGIYYLFHIGDCKIHVIRNGRKVKKITTDHSIDKYTLTRCMGINHSWKPDFIKNKVKNHSSYLVCSDGFSHKMDQESLCKGLEPKKFNNVNQMERALKEIGMRCIQRGERDNISAIYIKVN